MNLIPAIIRDARTGAVLTLAYMNDESLAKTRETGETWFWSRSRNELWHKGATSGNTQRVVHIAEDCDRDPRCYRPEKFRVLAEVEIGHTDHRTCGHDSRAKEKQLHRPRGSATSAGDHMPGREFEHRRGEQRAGQQYDERCKQGGEDP